MQKIVSRYLDYTTLAVVERKGIVSTTDFPYIPGLLSFREAPALLQVFAQLDTTPDVVVFDGQGIAHPRGLGIASHMGLLLDVPAIGCAKSRLDAIGSVIPSGMLPSMRIGSPGAQVTRMSRASRACRLWSISRVCNRSLTCRQYVRISRVLVWDC